MTSHPEAASRLAQWLAPLVLGGSLLIGILALVPNVALARGSGSALQYPPNSLKYPPIGAGIETMAAQPGGGYAIVLGNNCTIEILNCTTYTFPYGENPIQLVILDRTTLTPLFVQTYAGSALDAVTAGVLIQTSPLENKIVVILAPSWPAT